MIKELEHVGIEKVEQPFKGHALKARHDRVTRGDAAKSEQLRGCPLDNQRGFQSFRRKDRFFARVNPSFRTGARVGERLPRSATINWVD
jgi:hypothetical protein